MRTETVTLRQMRADRVSRILVTGAAGFLGSHIAVALAEAGYRVAVLVRASKGVPAAERIARLAAWFGLEEETARSLEILEGDLLDPGWAAGEPKVFDEVIHCASNTAFSERKRAEIEAANIDGLRNVLAFAAGRGCRFFHLVSTAYVAGRRAGLCPEDWVENGPFTNVYEETKARGEIMAREACRGAGIRLNVYRPTVVVGDSRTGRTLRFNALYYPVKMVVSIRDIYLSDIRQGDGRKAAEMGIRLTDDGRLFLPIRLESKPGGGLNLIPVDHCVHAFLALFEDAVEGGIYHIANPRTTPLADLVAFGLRRFGLEGVEVCGPEAFAARPKTALESLYESSLEVFLPYMQDARTFDTANAAPILEKRGLVCPSFDDATFARCMDYAIETGWGARLFVR